MSRTPTFYSLKLYCFKNMVFRSISLLNTPYSLGAALVLVPPPSLFPTFK